MYDVITIGAATRDVFLVSDQFLTVKSKKFATGMGECVALGSKIEINEIVLTTGGGATNAAATFGSLGFKTAAICRVGDDSPGKDVAEDLSRFGVSTRLVRRVKAGKTAYSTLLTMPDGERTVIVYRGTSSKFTSRDIPLSFLTQAKWIYLTSLGGNARLAKKVINAASKAGVKIAWNPGRKEIEAGLKELYPAIKKANVLNMNMEEARLLTKRRSIKQIFKALRADAMIRVVTDGTNGAYASCDGWTAHAATTGAKAVSRTGAGDAFGSGFVAGFIKTKDIKEALRVGTLNAESVILKHGAKNGILAKWPNNQKKKRVKIQKI